MSPAPARMHTQDVGSSATTLPPGLRTTRVRLSNVWDPVLGLEMDLQAPDEESMIRVVVAGLGNRFASIDRSRIEAVVQRLVREWSATARVKTFVGVIAERHARAELLQLRTEVEAGA